MTFTSEGFPDSTAEMQPRSKLLSRLAIPVEAAGDRVPLSFVYVRRNFHIGLNWPALGTYFFLTNHSSQRSGVILWRTLIEQVQPQNKGKGLRIGKKCFL